MQNITTGWQRSSFCATAGCIEVARIGGTVHLRDSKNPESPALVFTPSQWSGFQDHVLAIGKTC